jgi:hypothetical protein
VGFSRCEVLAWRATKQMHSLHTVWYSSGAQPNKWIHSTMWYSTKQFRSLEMHSAVPH